MSETSSEEPVRSAPARSSAKLSRLPRAASWVLGTIFGGLGTYAVFVSENQAGTAVLLALSALFTIVGLTGNVPHRLQIGADNVVEWPENVTEAVTTAIEEGSPEVAEKVVAAIADSAPERVFKVAAGRVVAESAERMADAVLRLAAIQLFPEDGPNLKVESLGHDGLIDFIIRSDDLDLAPLPVMVKAIRVLSYPNSVSYAECADQSAAGQLLIVTYDVEITHNARKVFDEKSNIHLLEVRSSDPLDNTVKKAREILRQVFSPNS